MEFEILAGVVIEHGFLITRLPGWPVITMTYHQVENMEYITRFSDMTNTTLRTHTSHRHTHINTIIYVHTRLYWLPQTRLSMFLRIKKDCSCSVLAHLWLWVGEMLCSASIIQFICRQAKHYFFCSFFHQMQRYQNNMQVFCLFYNNVTVQKTPVQQVSCKSTLCLKNNNKKKGSRQSCRP